MKNVLALTVYLMIGFAAYSQNPGGFQRGGGQQLTGRFYGKVVDPSNKGIEVATVTLVAMRMDSVTKKPKEVVIGGMLTTKLGDFSIENVPLFGRYHLKVTGIGYKAVDQQVNFDLPNRNAMNNNNSDPSALAGITDKDLGNIKLELSN